MSDQQPQPSEAEMRAAYEAQLKTLRVEDLLIETVISLLNLAGRRAGLAPGSEDERDLDQVHTAIEGVRALLPLCEATLGPDAGQIRGALSQLQMAYAQLVNESVPAGTPAPGGESTATPPPAPEPPAPAPGEAGPAQSSGRLWVPGQ